MGQALLAYWSGRTTARILTWSDIEGWDELPAAYLFRDFDQMPQLEQIALEMIRGRVLDLGAGAGSHALYLQQKGFDVYALDRSPGAAEVMQKRGLRQIWCGDFWDSPVPDHIPPVDTLLALMNGAGLSGGYRQLVPWLKRLRSWLRPGGQLLLDSADVLYLFSDVPGGQYMDLSKSYYGDCSYRMKYGHARCQAFGWLFVDYPRLAEAAIAAGFTPELIYAGKEEEYLARLLRREERAEEVVPQ